LDVRDRAAIHSPSDYGKVFREVADLKYWVQ